ncbi:MAG: hypothetical protein NT150_11600 [Bacteroidetes bacterium]|nr:hypothetical protein [Bacteroidota bacterium]
MKNISYLVVLIIAFASKVLFASGNANVDINNSSANGSWSYASSTYTWTPSANSSIINYTDIQNCFLGSGALGGSGLNSAATNGAHSITILTACSGAGSQSGNVTFTNGITAAVTNSSTMTFTITAAGSITVSNSITLTPASSGSAGYPGVALTWTAPSGITISTAVNVSGGTSTATAVGGAGGAINFTSSGGSIQISNTLTANGGIGGTGGGAGHGGAGGAINLTGTFVSTSAAISATGGQGSDSGDGAVGGAVTLTASSSYISVGNTITTTGGVGGGGNNAAGFGDGGAGGAITYTAVTYLNITTAQNASGGSGAGGGNGGNGGAITGTTTSSYITISNTITSNGGSSGVGGSNQSGGNGGAISFTSGDYYSDNTAMANSGGTCTGTGSSTGGAITLGGTGGISISNGITSQGYSGASLAAANYGALILNDGNVTVGGNNTGYTGGAWTVGSIEKKGAGNFSLACTNSQWTGDTKITAGKLTLGAAGVINDASRLNFNGGRLVMGAYSETVGTIMVSDYSVLDLPSGNYTLTTSASNGVTWTTGKKLGINYWGDVGNNYNGTGAGGSDPKFMNGASAGLDATHLAAIYFRRTSNGSTYTASQLGTGELVPTGTLPVELVSFSAIKNNDQVEVLWETASEINSEYFEILRAGSDLQWESIGKVNAAGNSNKLIDYKFIDAFPAPGINYYQLVEYDFDGKNQKSKIVSINSDNVVETKLSAYPNPTNGATTFDFYSEKGGTYFIKAFTQGGDQIYSARIFGIPGENKFNLSLADYSIGIYTFQLCDNNEKPLATTKVIKVD